MESITYNYRIYNEVYNDIKCKKKDIEFRLLNEKSEKIKLGDLIEFNVVDEPNKKIVVEVIDKLIYNDLEELWKDKKVIENNILNYSRDEFAELFYQIFGKEKVLNSKIVGFKFKLLKSNSTLS